MLINLIKAEKPTHLAVAFDTSRQSFRTREYAEYKANRSESPQRVQGPDPAAAGLPRRDEHPGAPRKRTSRPTTSSPPSRPRAPSRDYDVLVVLRRPRHHPARQRRRHPALPERAGRLAAQALRPRRRHRALRRAPRAVPRHRRARRRDQRQPARRAEGRREDRRQVARTSSARSTRCSRTPTRSRGVVGGNLREHLDDVRRNRTTQPPADATSSCRVTLADLEVQPIDAQAVRDIFARLEFKTLIPRVAELAGIEQQMAAISSAAAVARSRCRPSSRPTDFAAWLASADDEVGVTIADRGRAARADRLRDRDDSRGRSSTGPPSVAAALEPVARLRRARRSSATPSRRSRRSAAPASVSDGLAFDTIVAGWLLRPSFPDKTLADLVDRYLDEKLPEADPTQLVPETEGATPGQLSWYTLRVADALRDELPERRGGPHRHRAADAADPRRHGARRRRGLAREALGRSRASSATRADALAQRGVSRPSAARSTSVRRSSCRRCCSKSCSCPRPARRRPATRRMPPCSPTCRNRPASVPGPAPAPRGDQAAAS